MTIFLGTDHAGYKLKEKTKVKVDEAQVKTLAELEATRDKIRSDLNELEKSSATGWKKMKNKIAESIDKLNKKAQESLKAE